MSRRYQLKLRDAETVLVHAMLPLVPLRAVAQSMRAYMRGAQIAGIVADHLRSLGHSARSHTNRDSEVLHIPLVLEAGYVSSESNLRASLGGGGPRLRLTSTYGDLKVLKTR